ncbi:hypothetical protein [Maridesulfovibrio sp.]|uniref:hypothetical protein n=1 Tax=Maridesulfovibrio sp. TaxID=2795000 RepID=UPI0029F4D3BE|nr:hypothetical protein [Maridesulfovibrio sp.]
MKVGNSKGADFLKGLEADAFLGTAKESGLSPAMEQLTGLEGVDPDLLQRARDREEEERDLHVLDAYNRFELGLQAILRDPETGVMELRAGEAQAGVFVVNDFFAEEGGRLHDELPDDECRVLFMDILESRRKTAVKAVARHQSQEYQNWKERTAAQTIDSVLKAVNISPDASSLMHGEQLLEGAIMRLYRGSNPELLQLRLLSAKQAMYAGALETIGIKDPVSAFIMVESWKEQLGKMQYERLHDILEPLARNQHMKQEFNSLRYMEGEQIDAELADLRDDEMRRELSEMLEADRRFREKTERNFRAERMNIMCRELFKKFLEGQLTAGDILDTGLDPEIRSQWLLIAGSKGEKGSDEMLVSTVQGIIADEVTEEYQIYAAVVDGLCEDDASALAALFILKRSPEIRLMINSLREIGVRFRTYAGDLRDHAAAIRDFLQRVAAKAAKGEQFSITKVRNEVLDDHFVEKREEGKIQDDLTGAEVPESSEEMDLLAQNEVNEVEGTDMDADPEEGDKESLGKNGDAGYPDLE